MCIYTFHLPVVSLTIFFNHIIIIMPYYSIIMCDLCTRGHTIIILYFRRSPKKQFFTRLFSSAYQLIAIIVITGHCLFCTHTRALHYNNNKTGDNRKM